MPSHIKLFKFIEITTTVYYKEARKEPGFFIISFTQFPAPSHKNSEIATSIYLLPL